MKIDHIGIATRGIDEAATFWRETLGLNIEEAEEIAEIADGTLSSDPLLDQELNRIRKQLGQDGESQ